MEAFLRGENEGALWSTGAAAPCGVHGCAGGTALADRAGTILDDRGRRECTTGEVAIRTLGGGAEERATGMGIENVEGGATALDGMR